MGRGSIRKCTPYRRLPEVPDAQEGWELRHSPYTFEGEIEGLRRFGRGLAHGPERTGWMMWLGVILAVCFFGALIIQLVLLVLN